MPFDIVSSRFGRGAVCGQPLIEPPVALLLVRDAFEYLQIWQPINIVHVETKVGLWHPTAQQSGSGEAATGMDVVNVEPVAEVQRRVEQSQCREGVALPIPIAEHILNVVAGDDE